MFGFSRKKKGADSVGSDPRPHTTPSNNATDTSPATRPHPIPANNAADTSSATPGRKRRNRRRRSGRNSDAGSASPGHRMPSPQDRRDDRPARHETVPSAIEAPTRPQTAVSGDVFEVLIEPLRRAVADSGYREPTPIQAQTIPHLIDGRDLIGCAQTGTGKTAAFVLPILQGLNLRHHTRPQPRRPRALIVAPTRELAAQIGDSIATYGQHLRITHTVIFGGVKQHSQVRALTKGVDILAATPGRLLDLCQQGMVKLEDVEVFVLDEADRMLDMGFIPDIRKIVALLPNKRQSLFFSATMPPPVVSLAQAMVHDPVHVSITPDKPAVESIAQTMMFVNKTDKGDLLADLLSNHNLDRVIVFTRTKHMANRVAKKLSKSGVASAAIHGNKSQNARTQALDEFKAGNARVLVATDIAARGLDVDGISHVINFDLPNEPETYVHRIGRTARAGSDGDAISFCAADERDYLRDIERLLRTSIPVDEQHVYHSDKARHATGADARPAPRGMSSGGGGGGRRRR